jgi:hypothetical protein
MNTLFRKLNDYGITPNQFYVLHCLSLGMEPLNMNLHIEIRPLKKFGMIDKTTLAVTQFGIDVLKDLYSDGTKTKVQPKKTDVQLDMVIRYIELWPKIKLPSGKPARSDKKNIETNFKWFFTNYSYSWDVVLKATQMYIEEYESKSYKFMRTSQYFIKKSDADKSIQSELADYCSLCEGGGYVNPESVFTDKVV